MTSKPLNFDQLDKDPQEDRRFASAERWPSRNPNEQIQMSLRMPRGAYQKFRELCKDERRTNGDMLEVMMESYLRRERN